MHCVSLDIQITYFLSELNKSFYSHNGWVWDIHFYSGINAEQTSDWKKQYQTAFYDYWCRVFFFSCSKSLRKILVPTFQISICVFKLIKHKIKNLVPSLILFFVYNKERVFFLIWKITGTRNKIFNSYLVSKQVYVIYI